VDDWCRKFDVSVVLLFDCQNEKAINECYAHFFHKKSKHICCKKKQQTWIIENNNSHCNNQSFFIHTKNQTMQQPEVFGLQIDEERIKNSDKNKWQDFLQKIIEFCKYRYSNGEDSYNDEQRIAWSTQNKQWMDENKDKENTILSFLKVESTPQEVNTCLFLVQSLLCMMDNVITHDEFVLICRSSFSFDYEKIRSKRKISTK